MKFYTRVYQVCFFFIFVPIALSADTTREDRGEVNLYVLTDYESFGGYNLRSVFPTKDYRVIWGGKSVAELVDCCSSEENRSIPHDVDILMLANQQIDLSSAEVGYLRTYLASGGRLLMLLELSQLTESTPQLEELLRNYGLGLLRALVIEGDSDRYAYGRPFYLLPKYEYHDIVVSLLGEDLPMLLPGAMALRALENRRQSLTVEPLISSSDNSWGKVDYTTATTTSKEVRDIGGPFILAFAVTDPAVASDVRDTRIVVVASSKFLDSGLQEVAAGNGEFFLNSLYWLSQ